MTDALPPGTPAPPTPPAGTGELESLQKQHKELVYKLNMTEKEKASAIAEATTLKEQVGSASQSQIELLRLQSAYNAGIPSDLLPLITGSTKEEIDVQIKTIVGKLTTSSTAAPAGSLGETDPVKAAEAALAIARATADPVKAAEATLEAARVAADPIKAAEAVLEAAKATGTSMPTPPQPSGKPGESELDKYMKATPEDQQKMMEKWKETPGFVLT